MVEEEAKGRLEGRLECCTVNVLTSYNRHTQAGVTTSNLQTYGSQKP